MTVDSWLWLIADFTVIFAFLFLIMTIVVVIDIIRMKVQERKGK